MTFAEGLVVGLAALVVLLAAADAASKLAKRFRRASVADHPSAARTEECEVCGAEISIVVAHLVTSAFSDDIRLSGGTAFGGTAMSAAYCVNHCPGGCRQPSCPSRVVQ